MMNRISKKADLKDARKMLQTMMRKKYNLLRRT